MFTNWRKEYAKQSSRHHDAILEIRGWADFWKLKYLEASKEVVVLNRVIQRKNRTIERLKNDQK